MGYACNRVVLYAVATSLLFACTPLKAGKQRPPGSDAGVAGSAQGASEGSGKGGAGRGPSGGAGAGGARCPGLDSKPDCSADNVFCDDFAPRTDLQLASGGKRWSELESQSRWNQSGEGPVTVSLESQSPHDGGPALHLHLSGDQQDGRYGPFLYDLSAELALAPGSKLSMSFDFLSEGPGVYPWGFECGAGDGDARYSFSFNLDTNKVNDQLNETSASYMEFEAETKLKPETNYFDEWKHIDVVLDRAASTMTMCVDGEVVFPTVKLRGDLTRDNTGRSCELRLMYFAEPGSTWDGYYKNFKLVRQP